VKPDVRIHHEGHEGHEGKKRVVGAGKDARVRPVVNVPEQSPVCEGLARGWSGARLDGISSALVPFVSLVVREKFEQGDQSATGEANGV
jgi:hypothetical protein